MLRAGAKFKLGYPEAREVTSRRFGRCATKERLRATVGGDDAPSDVSNAGHLMSMNAATNYRARSNKDDSKFIDAGQSESERLWPGEY
eukprot:1382066-Amorphochlora_amoeboformis.AAC.2